MSSPGWYPDPSGQPNSFRYWDGQGWSQQTTDNPYVPPPSQWGAPPAQPAAPEPPTTPETTPEHAQPPAQPEQPQVDPAWGHTAVAPSAGSGPAQPGGDPVQPEAPQAQGWGQQADSGQQGGYDAGQQAAAQGGAHGGQQGWGQQGDPNQQGWGQQADPGQQGGWGQQGGYDAGQYGAAAQGTWGASSQPTPPVQGGWVDAGDQAPTQFGGDPYAQQGQPGYGQANFAQFGDQQWAPGPGHGDGGGGSSKKAMWIVIASVVAIALIVGGIVAAIQLTGDDDKDSDAKGDTSQTSDPSDEPTDEPTDDPGASLTDEPTTEAPPTDEPTDEPSDAVPAQPAADICTAGDPTLRETHPEDGRVHGGGLSMPSPKGYEQAPVANVYTFMTDLITLMRETQAEKWISVYALGAIPKTAAGSDLQAAAEAVVDCMANSPDFYLGMDSSTPVSSEAATVDGAEAWVARYEITVADPEVTAGGDVAQVIVVDTGDDDTYGLFATVVPLGDDALIKRMDKVASELRVE